jgi:hypothetical protein
MTNKMSTLGINHQKLLSTLGKQTPVTHAILRAKRGGGECGSMVAIVVIVLIGFVVGIILCNKYGLKHLTHTELHTQKNLQTALKHRFNLGLGTGIIAVTIGGKIGMLIIGLIILFVLGYELPLVAPAYDTGTLTAPSYKKRLVQKRYYMGLATGGLFGLVTNKLLIDALTRN